MRGEVDGKVAIVTGAASGIGKATAELLHARGAKVVAVDIAEDVQGLERDSMVTIVADVSREDSASKAVAVALDTFGKLDILVNNAGRIIYKPIVEMTLDDWNWQMQTNSTGAFLHTREALRAMTPNKSGAIVNIASYAAYYAFPGISAYTASKGCACTVDSDCSARSHQRWYPRKCDRGRRYGYNSSQPFPTRRTRFSAQARPTCTDWARRGAQ
jgi:NAD(P)-dependent dehydrogenase (short-subunit alcohol dehydrogenase family)